MAVRIGDVIRGYRLDNVIAKGATGVVYAATHESLKHRAALKILVPELARDEGYVSRFLEQARAVNDLGHPNIVQAFEYIDDPKHVAVVMEHLKGPTLATVFQKGKLTPKQAFNVAIQIADALAALHEAGIVHSDLRPEKVLIEGDLEGDLAHVGSLKIVGIDVPQSVGDSADEKTALGVMLGTMAYLSPEQMGGLAPVPASDLYALAELLYEALSGKRMYPGDNMQITAMKLAANPPSLAIPRDLFKGAAQIVALMRASVVGDPDERPSLEDFRMALLILGEEAGLIGVSPSDMSEDDESETTSPEGIANVDVVDQTISGMDAVPMPRSGSISDTGSGPAVKAFSGSKSGSRSSLGSSGGKSGSRSISGSLSRRRDDDDSSLAGVSNVFLAQIMEDFGEVESTAADNAGTKEPPPLDVPLHLVTEDEPEPVRPNARARDATPPPRAAPSPRGSSAIAAPRGAPSVPQPRGASTSGPRGAKALTPLKGVSFQPVAPPAQEAMIPIAMGVPERPSRKIPKSWIAILVVLTLIFAGIVYLWLDDSHLASEPVRDDVVAKREKVWSERKKPTEKFDVLFDLASSQHRRDTSDAYDAARDAIEKALMLQPGRARALALWAENEVIRRGDRLDAEDLAEVDAFSKLAVTSAPDDAEVLRARGLVELKRGSMTTATQLLTRALDAAPREARTRVAKADLLLDTDPQQALDLLDDATTSAAPRGWRVKAEALARLGSTHAALDALDKHPTAANPDGALVLQRARLALDAGEFARSREWIKKADKTGPDACSIRLFDAAMAPPDEAGTVFAAVAADESCATPLRARAEARLAGIELERRDLPMATTHAQAAIALVPGEPLASLAMAEVALLGGDGKKAREIIEANPNLPSRPDLAVVRAIAAATADDHPGARGAIEAALTLSTSPSYELRLVDVTLAWLAGDDAKVGPKLELLVDVDPLEDEDRIDHLAVSKLALDQLAHSIKSSSLAEKGWARAGLLTALIQMRIDRLDAADAALGAARMVKPMDDLTRVADGYLALSQNKPADAEKSARGLLAIKPGSAGAKLLVARALAAQPGKEAAAEKAFAEAVKSMPKSALAAVGLRTLEWRKSPKNAAAQSKVQALVRDYRGSLAARRLAFEAGL